MSEVITWKVSDHGLLYKDPQQRSPTVIIYGGIGPSMHRSNADGRLIEFAAPTFALWFSGPVRSVDGRARRDCLPTSGGRLVVSVLLCHGDSANSGMWYDRFSVKPGTVTRRCFGPDVAASILIDFSRDGLPEGIFYSCSRLLRPLSSPAAGIHSARWGADA
ncbi:hypothetical protein [Planobispora longispora]|uniref:hypothetical protein n=1 Tax=Planobispora longispora TaxID=28887 RepID=UPI00194356D3|nr:hypothetical protein [Planobispora longispora]